MKSDFLLLESHFRNYVLFQVSTIVAEVSGNTDFQFTG